MLYIALETNKVIFFSKKGKDAAFVSCTAYEADITHEGAFVYSPGVSEEEVALTERVASVYDFIWANWRNLCTI